ncbi:MAG: hypothetical protein OQL20_02250 [Sedimenticola sp.]|nr:hypothetical protein [Sedimenticola sp.]
MHKNWSYIVRIGLLLLAGPPTAFYILALLFSFLVPLANGAFRVEAFLLASYLLVPGIGLFSLWKIGLGWEGYARNGIPIQHKAGLLIGVATFIYLAFSFGPVAFLEPLLILVLGLGPLLALAIMLYAMWRFKKDQHANSSIFRA